MTTRILIGDCRDVLKTLPDESVHCCVTSPPYWALRSYLPAEHPNKHLEIGSEPTLQQWVDTMVDVFREVRRLLRPDGTLWLNLGDAYARDMGKGGSGPDGKNSDYSDSYSEAQRRRTDFLKPKDMMGQPWRVAFALQADGWWLRQEIIWSKPNPMPESTRDRCTKAHEHVFLLSKSERYFYDFDAMQEPVSGTANARGPAKYKTPDGWGTRTGEGGHGAYHAEGREKGKYGHLTGQDTDGAHRTKAGLNKPGNGVGFGHGTDGQARGRGRVAGVNPKAAESSDGSRQNASFSAAVADLVDTRNPRSVWTIPTHPFKGAHFATFPPALAERCITAGCPEGGTVLDPFGGSGTVGMVADRQHKHAILIDLDERNLPMATERIQGDSPLFAQVST